MKNKGFTLLEILLVITLIGILVSILLVSINPNRQLAQARNLGRKVDIDNINDALEIYKVRNRGSIISKITNQYQEICDTGNRSLNESLPSNDYCSGKLDLRDLVPTYISNIPKDSQAKATGSTGYEVAKDNKNQISIIAKNAELGESVSINAPSDTLYAKAGAFPSLDLNFATNKSLIDTISGNNLVDFSRNSIGTYVGSDGLIKTAAANQPRFDHNPTTGQSLGLLMEESRSNVSVASESFSTGYTARNSLLQQNATVSPNGTNTGVKLIESLNSISRFKEIDYTNSSATQTLGTGNVTHSIFVKKGERNIVFMGNYFSTPSHWIGFDLTSETFFTVSGYTPAEVYNFQKFNDGWYRIWYTVNLTTNNGARFDVTTGLDKQMTSYTGDGSSGIYIWGQSIEKGSFPTSYIPTSGSIVTRQLDNALITGNNFSKWYNNTGGSVLFHSALGETINSTPSIRFGNYLWSTAANTWSNIDNQTIMNTNSSRATMSKHAISLQQNEHAISINGGEVLVSSQNNNTSPASTGQLSLNSPGINLNGYISRITYWPFRVSNSTLKSISQ